MPEAIDATTLIAWSLGGTVAGLGVMLIYTIAMILATVRGDDRDE